MGLGFLPRLFIAVRGFGFRAWDLWTHGPGVYFQGAGTNSLGPARSGEGIRLQAFKLFVFCLVLTREWGNGLRGLLLGIIWGLLQGSMPPFPTKHQTTRQALVELTSLDLPVLPGSPIFEDDSDSRSRNGISDAAPNPKPSTPKSLTRNAFQPNLKPN